MSLVRVCTTQESRSGCYGSAVKRVPCATDYSATCLNPPQQPLPPQPLPASPVIGRIASKSYSSPRWPIRCVGGTGSGVARSSFLYLRPVLAQDKVNKDCSVMEDRSIVLLYACTCVWLHVLAKKCVWRLPHMLPFSTRWKYYCQSELLQTSGETSSINTEKKLLLMPRKQIMRLVVWHRAAPLGFILLFLLAVPPLSWSSVKCIVDLS